MDNSYPIADPFSEIYGNTAIDNIVGKDEVINTEVKRLKGLVSRSTLHPTLQVTTVSDLNRVLSDVQKSKTENWSKDRVTNMYRMVFTYLYHMATYLDYRRLYKIA